MKYKNKIFRMLVQVLVLVLIGGVFTGNLGGYTFAADLDVPNVIIKINEDGSVTQEGNLFDGLFYTNDVDYAEDACSISGAIRIYNNYKEIDIVNVPIGLENLEIRYNYSEDVLKVEKGSMFSFNKTFVNYTSISNLLYEVNGDDFKGYVIDSEEIFIIAKGETIDFIYTLHMVEEAGSEFHSATAYNPIYIDIEIVPVICNENTQ